MKHLHLMFLAGAGGVGKTSTAEALVRQIGNANYVRYVPSSVRASNRAAGFQTEEVAIASDIDLRKAKQALVRRNYRDNLYAEIKSFTEQATGRAHDKQLLVIDRSPFDHVAYSLVDIPTLSLSEISTLTRKAVFALHGLARAVDATSGLRATYTTSIVLFDYPTPWATSGKDAPDGFRASSTMNARNFVWAKTLKCLIEDAVVASGLGILTGTFESGNHDDVDTRALTLLQISRM